MADTEADRRAESVVGQCDVCDRFIPLGAASCVCTDGFVFVDGAITQEQADAVERAHIDGEEDDGLCTDETPCGNCSRPDPPELIDGCRCGHARSSHGSVITRCTICACEQFDGDADG